MSEMNRQWPSAPRPVVGATPLNAAAAAVPGPQPLPPAAATGSMPRAAWIAIALLGMLSAALAGALLMRASTPTAPPAAALAMMSSPTALQAGLAPQEAPPRLLPQPVDVQAGTQLAPAPLPAVAPAAEPARQAPTATAPPLPAAPVARAAEPVPAPQPRPPAPHRVVTRQHQHTAQPLREARAVACTGCGVVESVVPLRSEGQGTGLGAVGGGVLGAVVGNQMGGGNGKKAMAVLGAIGGGFAGNEVEKRVRSTTVYEVRVRMDDGSRRTLRQEQPPAVGTRLVLDGGRS